MLTAGIIGGERPALREWVGFIFGIGGLVYLVLPGLNAPSTTGAILMAASGVSWGIYSLRGARTTSPLAETTGNFLRTVPFAICLALITFQLATVSTEGVFYAILSGAIASGIGYVVWYFALSGLLSSHAAIVQLCVPVIAAMGGVIFLAEQITPRLVIAAIMILGGITLTILGHARE
jgi:drug/metabolite transporter (DMT)-like permease